MATNGNVHQGRPSIRAVEALGGVDLVELLEHDPRPILVLNLEDLSSINGQQLPTYFYNPALASDNALLELLQVNGGNGTCTSSAKELLDFKKWAISASTPEGPLIDDISTHTYRDFLWSFTELRKRWRIITGVPMRRRRGDASRKASQNDASISASRATHTCEAPPASGVSSKVGVYAQDSLVHTSKSWLDTLPKSEHVEFFLTTDWSSTSLGPIETWSGLLPQMTRMVMSDSRSACLFWGPAKVAVYNEAYVHVASKKHPGFMGATIQQSWGEIAQQVEAGFDAAKGAGYAFTTKDAPLFVIRHGYLEEAYFSYNLIPIRDEFGQTEGFYNTCFETTKQVIWERRTSTLTAIVKSPSLALFWREVLNGLESNALDIPLAAIYSIEKSHTDDGLGPTVHFQAGLGVSTGHPLAINPSNMDRSPEPAVQIFRKSLLSVDPLVLDREDGSLPEFLLEGVYWRGFGEPSKTVVVLPLKAGEETLGFLLMGTNPRRAYDEDYSGFLNLLSRQLSTSLSSAVIIEQAWQKEAELSKDLAEGQARFKAMTELNTAGLFYISLGGAVIYANDRWYEITGIPRDDDTDMMFMEHVLEEDRAFMETEWHNLAVLQIARTFELRMVQKWYHKESDSWKNIWLLCCCSHDRNLDGSVKSIMGCVTDISFQKQAQDDALDRATLSEQLARSEQEALAIQTSSRMEAEEAKKNMEKFMDITSHEMRNPLSAILQSADGIATSLQDFQSSEKTAADADELVESSTESIQIINLCAQHQGRIINDVLTLSKLDSAMLAVSPTHTQPAMIVRGALKMFEGELQSHNIKLEFSFDKSYEECAIDWVMLDPSRVTQILINLMTNAIKFTRSEATRFITVFVGGSVAKPPIVEHVNPKWFPSRGASSKRDLTSDDGWGAGEQIFVYFAVQDTGRGLDEEEKTRLFERFAQANQRTHVKYGGSGLGLFISRELTELHGGEIGLHSEAGVGSTFAFYVKGRRADQPAPSSPTVKAHSLIDAKQSPSKHGRQSSTSAPLYHILLVEDNLVNQKVLSKQLRKAGCTVHVANHGEEALARLEESKLWMGNSNGIELEIVLMDLEMPVMDGLTCARQIRILQQKGMLVRHVPLIAVTANAREEQIEISMAAGMDDVMPKPFRVAELLPKMERLKSMNS